MHEKDEPPAPKPLQPSRWLYEDPQYYRSPPDRNCLRTLIRLILWIIGGWLLILALLQAYCKF